MAVQRTIIALLLDEEDEEQTKRNRIWSRPWIIKRQQYGAFHTPFAELKLDNLAFKDYLRLDKTQFELLLQKVHKHIIKQHTNMRECIELEEMCCLTLRYLASGESFRSLEFQFRIGKRTISNIILDVCMAIIEELRSDYLTTPNTEDLWLDISKKFFLRWNFPNGIGAIDGKHIVIEQPSHSGSHYRNYKGTDSIVIMAMIPHRRLLMPYVCTGDDAFPLSKYMMKPYPFKSLSVDKKIFAGVCFVDHFY